MSQTDINEKDGLVFFLSGLFQYFVFSFSFCAFLCRTMSWNSASGLNMQITCGTAGLPPSSSALGQRFGGSSGLWATTTSPAWTSELRRSHRVKMLMFPFKLTFFPPFVVSARRVWTGDCTLRWRCPWKRIKASLSAGLIKSTISMLVYLLQITNWYVNTCFVNKMLTMTARLRCISLFNLGGVYGCRAEWAPLGVLEEAEGHPDQQLQRAIHAG